MSIQYDRSAYNVSLHLIINPAHSLVGVRYLMWSLWLIVAVEKFGAPDPTILHTYVIAQTSGTIVHINEVVTRSAAMCVCAPYSAAAQQSGGEMWPN